MTTTLPRIQAYLPLELHQQFLEWKQEKGFHKDSQAFTQLLSEFFAGVDSSREVDEQIGDLEGIITETVKCAINDLKPQIIAEVLKATADHKPDHTLKDQLYQLEQKQEELLQEVGTVLAGEKSLLSSLTAKVMALQSKLDNLALSVRELPSELPSELPGELPETDSILLAEEELAKRLDIAKGTLSKNRSKLNFSEWSQARDPEALSWEYDADLKLYRQKPKSAPIAEEPEESVEEGALVPYDKNNLPEVGDRCYSELNGKEGEVIETNARRTKILWDNNKKRGLPPTEYSATDLEVMRICKGKWTEK